MFYYLARLLEEYGGPAVFRFVTSRSVFAFISAFIITLIIGRPLIIRLYQKGYRSAERSYGDINTASKAGTPMMGGLMLLLSGLGSAVIWCDLANPFVLILIVASLYFAAMGLADDMLKVRNRNPDDGLSRTAKFAGQILFGIGLGVFMLHPDLTPLPAGFATEVHIPFFKHALFDAGWLYLGFIVFIIVYSANAVNFADGMDGLAIVPSFFVILVLGAFAFIIGNKHHSANLLYEHLPRSGEMVVYCAAVGGSMLGFLWFNAHPAQIFMGDTGSLFLGGTMGTAAVLIKQEFVFILAGGIFVAEIASTFFQDYVGFRILKRRLFCRAPIHHTFAHRGMMESKVVIRFWIISAILAALAVATLKVR